MKRKVIIFINYSIIIDIIYQITFSSLFFNKINLRFIRISQYASQFNLNMR